MAQERARAAGGTLILRVEDLDRARCRTEYVDALFEDLRWFGFEWQEGPDLGGPYQPYFQSQRLHLYRETFRRLREQGLLFPCTCSRKDIALALSAPHAGDEEPVYPGTCRGNASTDDAPDRDFRGAWRFRVPDGEVIRFKDGCQGEQQFIAGVDFGDFVVWRSDDLPSYQLACVTDDLLMGITEVVRGVDLLASTARQILLFRALGKSPPSYFHCPLILDERGRRLAKRHDSLSLRAMGGSGLTPEQIRETWRDGTS